MALSIVDVSKEARYIRVVLSESCPIASLIIESGMFLLLAILAQLCRATYVVNGGSRNLVGIAIQLSDSEEEEFFVGYPMLISPEKFDFGIERFGCGI